MLLVAHIILVIIFDITHYYFPTRNGASWGQGISVVINSRQNSAYMLNKLLLNRIEGILSVSDFKHALKTKYTGLCTVMMSVRLWHGCSIHFPCVHRSAAAFALPHYFHLEERPEKTRSPRSTSGRTEFLPMQETTQVRSPVEKIPWGRAWQPLLDFLPEKSHDR